MLVKFKRKIDGVNDGDYYPTTYSEGEQADIGPDLYRAFSGIGGIIVDVVEKELKPEYEKKVIEPKKQNKTTKKGGKK